MPGGSTRRELDHDRSRRHGCRLPRPTSRRRTRRSTTSGRYADVRDTVGHGTFVAALAAGSVTNGEGIAGFGGDAKLLVVKAEPATDRSPTSTKRTRSSTRSTRSADHQPQLRRPDNDGDRKARHRLRRDPRRARRRPRRQRVRGRAIPSSIRQRCSSPSARKVAVDAGSRSVLRRTGARAAFSNSGHVPLARRAGRERLLARSPRRRLPRASRASPAGLVPRSLRLRQRNLVRRAAGVGCGCSRDGGQSVPRRRRASRRCSRRAPPATARGRRPRLRSPRRRRGGRARAGQSQASA